MSVRYVAGIGVESTDDGPLTRYHVVRLVEDERGERLVQPVFVITDMDAVQAEHLWMQIGGALGIMDSTGALNPKWAQRDAAALAFHEDTGEHNSGAFHAGWDAARKAGLR